MTPGSFWYRALDPWADAFDPALTVFALAVPWMRGSWPGWRAAARYGMAGAAGLAAIYGVAALDALFGLWSAVGLDYSTHTAYAVSLATTIVVWDRRWTRTVVLAVGAYALLILLVGYHDLADVLCAALVAALATWPIARRLLQPPSGSPTRAPSEPLRP
ncbi:MAG: hypothetical protein U0X73_08015 [Thermoanaerobaculia bacterium]